MDNLFAIRAGIFLIAGVGTILFRGKLDNFKNNMLGKLNMKSKIKDERKSYVYFGIVFITISIILFIYSITH